MKIDVLWTPSELEQVQIQDRTAVVIDVLRSGTTIATAIHNGAKAVVPAASTEDAIRIALSIGRRDVLLCGERGGEQIEGFDLGNSPKDFSPATVGERTVVMSTTNGTHTIAALSAGVVYIGALVNLTPLAERLVDADGDMVIVCAGRNFRVCVEDALCAGLLIEAIVKIARRNRRARPELADGAIAAQALAKELAPVDSRFLRNTAAGRGLVAIGQGDDIKLCAKLDAVPVVPVLRESQIVKYQ